MLCSQALPALLNDSFSLRAKKVSVLIICRYKQSQSRARTVSARRSQSSMADVVSMTNKDDGCIDDNRCDHEWREKGMVVGGERKSKKSAVMKLKVKRER